MATYPINSMLVSNDDGIILGQMNQNFGFPSGTILMWYSSDSIPNGWTECNGQNGTPDLRGRFPLGEGGTYKAGNIGGEQTVTLNGFHLPSHNHTLADTTPQDCRDGMFVGTSGCWLSGPPTTVRRNTSSVGSSTPHNNMPPYFVLRFIMKR